MKALVGAFNQEKALVGAFSVIVQPVVEPMEHYTALLQAENEAMAAKVAASLAKHGGKTEDEVNVEDVSEYLNAKYTTETE